jgi:hypothetical protein
VNEHFGTLSPRSDHPASSDATCEFVQQRRTRWKATFKL